MELILKIRVTILPEPSKGTSVSNLQMIQGVKHVFQSVRKESEKTHWVSWMLRYKGLNKKIQANVWKTAKKGIKKLAQIVLLAVFE